MMPFSHYAWLAIENLGDLGALICFLAGLFHLGRGGLNALRSKKGQIRQDLVRGGLGILCCSLLLTLAVISTSIYGLGLLVMALLALFAIKRQKSEKQNILAARSLTGLIIVLLLLWGAAWLGDHFYQLPHPSPDLGDTIAPSGSAPAPIP